MRLIDADELLRHERKMLGFDKYPDSGWWGKAVLTEDIKKATTIDPVKHGYWISKNDGPYNRWRLYCSVCGKHSGLVKEKPYCPNCGAKMDDKSKVL